ncbi:transcription factor SOX-18-like [Sebastes fasciatus]|uniref:transcription factor SOX-18-like n=1 Tax=Sebastes fasciatus TaxID=394691 RepID=UPI003D9E7AEE
MGKRERQEADPPYVKKPPNAFMVFIKEQRANVNAQINMGGRGSAAVNTVLGQVWSSLTREEQVKYYDMANEERLLHAKQNPEWTSSNNYGKKNKKPRRLCVSVQTALMEPSSSRAAVTAALPHTETVLVLQPQTQTTVTLPVCDMCHLPQLYKVGPACWLNPSSHVAGLSCHTDSNTDRVRTLRGRQRTGVSQ